MYSLPTSLRLALKTPPRSSPPVAQQPPDSRRLADNSLAGHTSRGWVANGKSITRPTDIPGPANELLEREKGTLNYGSRIRTLPHRQVDAINLIGFGAILSSVLF
jgi:hypothetical protein